MSKGDRVVLFSENRPEWHVVDFACHLLGAVSVPMYATLPAAQVRYIVGDCGGKLLLVSGKERAPDGARGGARPADGPGRSGIDPGLAEGMECLDDLPLPVEEAAERAGAAGGDPTWRA